MEAGESLANAADPASAAKAPATTMRRHGQCLSPSGIASPFFRKWRLCIEPYLVPLYQVVKRGAGPFRTALPFPKREPPRLRPAAIADPRLDSPRGRPVRGHRNVTRSPNRYDNTSRFSMLRRISLILFF